MKRRIVLTIIIAIQMMCITACWGSEEINAIGIVTLATFDIEEGEIVITAEVIIPKPPLGTTESAAKENAKYVQGRGKTLFKAVRNITSKFDRRLYLSQNQVFIFGEEFAKKGLANYLDFLLRDHEIRETAYLLVAKGSKAYELIGISAGIEGLSGIYIGDLIKNSKFNLKSVGINMVDYQKNYYDAGIQPILGKIEKEEMTIEKLEEKKKKEIALTIEGASVFKRDKIVGFLNGTETEGYNFVRNKIKGGVVEFSTPTINLDMSLTPTPKSGDIIITKNHKQDGFTVVEIVRSKTKNDLEIQDGKIILKTKVNVIGMLGEETVDIDTSREEVLKLLEKSCSNQVKRQIETVIKKAQEEYKVDIFGYGRLFYRKDPKEWKKIKNNWDDIFSQAEVKVDVTTKIVTTGLSNAPSSKVKGE